MRIRIVDAFTDRPFAGNPAGVLVLDTDAFPHDEWLQQVAAEINLSETAFAHPLPGDTEANWALRWFTPICEVSLCGHATLATAHVLRSIGAVTGTVRFSTLSGVLSAVAEDNGSVTLDFPTSPLSAVEAPAELAAALGAEILSLHAVAEQASGKFLAELADEKAVTTLAPDFVALARICRRGVIVTALADNATRDYDFVSRFFAPALGINEDPVTGSAHTALAPFWSVRLNREELTGFQASTRGGLVRTALRGDRTLLTGGAVTVIDGVLVDQDRS